MPFDLYGTLAKEFGLNRNDVKTILMAFMYRADFPETNSEKDLLDTCREYLRTVVGGDDES